MGVRAMSADIRRRVDALNEIYEALHRDLWRLSSKECAVVNRALFPLGHAIAELEAAGTRRAVRARLGAL